jgi:phosphate starvation-inducible membrane PsiE
MSEKDHGDHWTSKASTYLGYSESAVLVLIGIALVMVALLLLFAGMHDLWTAAMGGTETIEHNSIQILNTILLVMMTMEIVYTVAISLKSHTLNAEPFLIIGSIAAIRRMLVITATSTDNELARPDVFRNSLVELGLLSATVIAMAVAIWILRFSQRKYVDTPATTPVKPTSHS